MPKPRRQVEHIIITPKDGTRPLGQIHHRGPVELNDELSRGAEEASKITGLNVGISRSSGKAMASMSGISPEQWARLKRSLRVSRGKRKKPQ